MNVRTSSPESKSDQAQISGILKWGLVNLVFLSALAFSLFLSAGRVNWLLGWVYLGVLVTVQAATTLLLLCTNPTLLAERAWMQKGSKGWDTVIVSLGDAGWMSIGIVAGLDTRFNWTPHLEIGIISIGWALLIVGFTIFLWALASNRFFSSFVRIQTERGHMVETRGPYRYVRHPGYVGAILTYIASPLALASLWTYVPTILLLILFLFRTALEDRTLQRELEDYKEYARRVRYRLLPGVW